MIVQITGNPTTGKSTFIKKFVEEHENWKWIDIIKWNNENKNWLSVQCELLDNIKNSEFYIVESIMGFHQIKKSFNILFTCELKDLKHRHMLRKEPFNNEILDYYSSLSYQSVKPNLIINTSINNTYDKILYQLKPYILK